MSLTRRIAALAIPAFAALIAHPLMLLADTWIVGRLGTLPLAGLSIGSGLLLTVTGLCIFLAYGSTSVVARQVGAGNLRRGVELGIQAMWLAAALGVVLATGLWPLAGVLSSALGATSETLGYATSYLQWSLPGLPAMLVMIAATGTFRGLADGRTPLVLSACASALNLVLNVVFVFGLQLGVGGAGLGTATAELAFGASAVWLIVRAARREGAALAPDLSQMRRSLMLGAPLWLRTVALRAALLLTTYVAAAQGSAALAAHHITMNLWGLLANALDAIAIAGQTIIALALGASDTAEARQSIRLMTRWSVGTGVMLGLVTIVLRSPIAAFFSTDAQVQRFIMMLLLVVGVTLGLAGFVFLLDGVLIGAGDGPYLAKASFITLAAYAPLAVGALWLPQGLVGLVWLWVAFTVGFMGARAVTLGLRARGDAWMRLGA